MITQIKILNFQAHKKLVLDLHEGVNTIVGPSDVGKSAIIRAIRWAVFNEPSGDAFRSSWGGKTAVVLKTSEGDTITRVRTDKDNYYKLNRETFKAFGRGVPEPVQKALNMNVGNFQFQMDSPFLLSNTPTEVAKQLNEVANLKEIDLAISRCSSRIRNTQGDIRTSTARVEELETDLEEYANLNDIEKSVVRLEKLAGQVMDLNKRQSAVAGILRRFRGVLEEIADLSEYPEGVEDRIDVILDLKSRQKQVSTSYEKLKDLLGRINRTEEAVEDAYGEAAQVELEYKEAINGEICPLCGNEF